MKHRCSICGKEYRHAETAKECERAHAGDTASQLQKVDTLIAAADQTVETLNRRLSAIKKQSSRPWWRLP